MSYSAAAPKAPPQPPGVGWLGCWCKFDEGLYRAEVAGIAQAIEIGY